MDVALIAFPGVEPLDVVGPASVFAKAAALRPGAYRVLIGSPQGGCLAAAGGISLADTVPLEALPDALDTVLVAGGEEPALRAAIQAGVPAWIAGVSGCRRLGSVCTGAFLLAAAGLLDGRRAATHWRAAARLQALFPRVRVDPAPIYLFDRFYTSAGVTAGIDLALALVAADHGQPLATAVARELVVYAQRAGGQGQYSRALLAQATASPKLAELIDWMLENLDAAVDVAGLAARAGMAERTFARAFVAATGLPPGRFLMLARLERAKSLLETTPWPLARIAAECGFGSVDALQRAFRVHGQGTPGGQRRRFGAGMPSART